jgi:hypothetical protein
MEQLKFNVLVAVNDMPSLQQIVTSVEKELKDGNARVVSITESVKCPVCQENAEITTTFESKRERRKWSWPWREERISYALSSTHRCYKESAERYADDKSPWKRKVV